MSKFEGDEFEVLYDWDAENDEDLQLLAGEIIMVLQKNDHGWWYGVINRGSTLHKGYFPKNYVKPKVWEEEVPQPPPRPNNTGAEASDVAEVSNNLGQVSVSGSSSGAGSAAGGGERGESARSSTASSNPRSSSKSRKTFSVKSLGAFDDLSEKGYCVEIDTVASAEAVASSPGGGAEKGVPGGAAGLVTAGMRVTVKCLAMVWDGASTVTRAFCSGEVSFTVGKGQVPGGLDLSMLQLSVGQIATVTVAPQMAYGPAGNPPTVPPNSFVVYRVELKAAIAGGGADSPASGPTELLTSGIANTTSGGRPKSKMYSSQRNKQGAAMLMPGDEALLLAAVGDTEGGSNGSAKTKE